MVNGGEKAEEPKEPKRGGYTFGGWYYIDESGKEVKWDFDQPVNDSMRLTAKWDLVPKEPSSKEKKPTERQKTEQRKQTPQKWKYKEVKEKRRLRTAKTGDEKGAMWPVLCLAGASGIFIFCLLRKR